MTRVAHNNRVFLPVLLLLATAGTMVCTPASADDTAVPKELHGLWKVIKLEAARPMPQQLADMIKLEFTKTTFIVRSGPKSREFDVKFEKKGDAKSDSPSVFTMSEKDGPKKGQTGRVLYEMTKDGKLIVCVPNGPDKEEEAPIKDFEGGKKSPRHLVLTMEKTKKPQEGSDK